MNQGQIKLRYASDHRKTNDQFTVLDINLAS